MLKFTTQKHRKFLSKKSVKIVMKNVQKSLNALLRLKKVKKLGLSAINSLKSQAMKKKIKPSVKKYLVLNLRNS